MTDRWQQIEKICQAALELEESQRQAFLKEACAGDEKLRQEVESLLRYDKPGERFIEEPALEVAAKMVGARTSVADRPTTRLIPDPVYVGCWRDGCCLQRTRCTAE